MTDLTEQWQKGELPNGWYWCECYNEEIKILYYNGDCFELDDPETKNYYFFLKKDSAEIAILEKASYEEWQANQKWIKHLEEVIKIYERKEKQHTDDAIAYNELKESFDLIKSSLYSMTKVWNSTREDCRTLAQKLLQVKPELRDWLEVNYGEYVEQQKDWVNGI